MEQAQETANSSSPQKESKVEMFHIGDPAWTQMIKPKTGSSAGGKLAQVRKKIDQLRTLMRPESKIYRDKIPKTLEFGHEFTISYKRHTAGGPVKNIFYNENIRSYVSYNEKQLHVWRANNSQQVMGINFFDATQSHSISCIVYSKTHQIYLAISNDFKLHVFNEHLIMIGWLPLKIRLVNFAYFYEEKSTLITGGIDGCHMFKFNVMSKYEPKQACLLDPEGLTFKAELGPKIKLEKMPLWIKGLKVSVKQNVIFSWSQLKQCFNDLDGKILFRYKKLTSYEDYITDIFVSEKYRYFVTSTFTGQIVVWKLQKRKELIHTYHSHRKCVTSLQEIPEQPTLFISASNDNTIRIFSLDKFSELYSFILPAGVANINLLSERIFACFYNDQINIGILHHLALSFYNSKIEVKKIKKMFQSEEDMHENKSDIIMTLFSDNSVQLQKSDPNEHPSMVSTIYPPPGAKEVLYLGYCMNLDRIILVLVSGTICVYRIDENKTTILEKLLYSNQIKDSLGRNLSQNVTSVTLTKIIPPKFDVEIFNEGSAEDLRLFEEAYQAEEAKYPQDQIDRFLVLGLSKGTVIFLAVDKLDTIYARFFFHRQAINSIIDIPEHQKFITICVEMNIALWGFENNRQKLLSFNQMYRPISGITSHNGTVMLGFDSGDLHILKFSEDAQDLICLKTDSVLEHEQSISDIAYFSKKNMFITSSADGYVKVWNIKKELIREIKFPEPVYSVSFLNEEGDILVGHHGKVSIVAAKDYAPHEIPKLFNPPQEDLDKFYHKHRSNIVDSDTYLVLKQKDDEVKRQNQILMSKGGQSQQKKGSLQKIRINSFSSESTAQKEENKITERKLSIESPDQGSSQYTSEGSDVDQEINLLSARTVKSVKKPQQQTSQNTSPQKDSPNKEAYISVNDQQNDYVAKQKRPKKVYSQPPPPLILTAEQQEAIKRRKEREEEERLQAEYHASLDYTTYTQTQTAIPRKVTELNYLIAIHRLMHVNEKSQHQTRRDLTLKRISDNIMMFNNPIGQEQKFQSQIIGKSHTLANMGRNYFTNEYQDLQNSANPTRHDESFRTRTIKSRREAQQQAYEDTSRIEKSSKKFQSPNRTKHINTGQHSTSLQNLLAYGNQDIASPNRLSETTAILPHNQSQQKLVKSHSKPATLVRQVSLSKHDTSQEKPLQIRPSIGQKSNFQSEFMISEDQYLTDQKKSSLKETNLSIENPFHSTKDPKEKPNRDSVQPSSMEKTSNLDRSGDISQTQKIQSNQVLKNSQSQEQIQFNDQAKQPSNFDVQQIDEILPDFPQIMISQDSLVGETRVNSKATDNRLALEKIKNLQRNSNMMPSINRPSGLKLTPQTLEVNASKLANFGQNSSMMLVNQSDLSHFLNQKSKGHLINQIPVKKNLVAKKSQNFQIKSTLLSNKNQIQHQKLLQDDSIMMGSIDEAYDWAHASSIQGRALGKSEKRSILSKDNSQFQTQQSSMAKNQTSILQNLHQSAMKTSSIATEADDLNQNFDLNVPSRNEFDNDLNYRSVMQTKDSRERSYNAGKLSLAKICNSRYYEASTVLSQSRLMKNQHQNTTLSLPQLMAGIDNKKQSNSVMQQKSQYMSKTLVPSQLPYRRSNLKQRNTRGVLQKGPAQLKKQILPAMRGGLTESSGALHVSSGGGIGVPRIQMDNSFDSQEGPKKLQNTLEKSSLSQSSRKIGAQQVSVINQQAIESLLKRIDEKQPMNSSNISFNIHAQYQVSKFQQGPNFLSKNKKMKKTILASINSQDFSSSDMNTGLNTSKLKLQSKEIMNKMPFSDLKKSIESQNSSPGTHFHSKAPSQRGINN